MTHLRDEQEESRERGELMGIGMAFFTEAVGAGPRKDMDILGLGMADGCELRVHPTGKAVVRLSVQTQGQGHETTFAQIVAEELGIPPDDIEVVHGDTDQTPFGLGTYGSRSTPVSGAAAALVARKVRDKAKIIASGMLEASIADLEWEKGSFHVKGDPSASVTIADIAMRAHGAGDLPEGIEGGLDAQICYNPENLTYPYGAYFCVVDIDPGTAVVKVRRFLAVDDCGTRINPMIIEGQIHGGIVDGIGMALMEIIAFDEEGNCLGGSLMDYLIPTALEVPHLETGFTATPSPHHPIGAKGIGESATVGSPPAVVNAVVDALAPFGVRHADMPLTPSRVWEAMQGRADATDLEDTPNDDQRARGAAACAARTPFVHATVVRAQQPTSAHPGDEAILLADGTIEGFVGGHCAQNSVRKAALGALQAGESVLLRVLPDGDVHFPEAPGACVMVNPCLSGGALEIFLEPRLPAPLIGICGATPIADSGRRVVRSAGLRQWRATIPRITSELTPRRGRDRQPRRAGGRDDPRSAGRRRRVYRPGGKQDARRLDPRRAGAFRRRARTGAHAGRIGHRCEDACRDRGVDRRRIIRESARRLVSLGPVPRPSTRMRHDRRHRADTEHLRVTTRLLVLLPGVPLVIRGESALMTPPSDRCRAGSGRSARLGTPKQFCRRVIRRCSARR